MSTGRAKIRLKNKNMGDFFVYWRKNYTVQKTITDAL
jgi:hypothetical protein